MDAVTRSQRYAQQDRYEENYFRREEEDRPRPTHTIDALTTLANKAKDDPSAALEFSLACTPQTFLLALADKRWEDQHPFYSCIHCHDGKDLPEGYVCQVCEADSPLTRH